ncbi:MAG: hypothetical protein HY547_02590 [Elusimicrobia bacterium]|nr:hypothetical protein [Elusimicrobiota bacterium]
MPPTLQATLSVKPGIYGRLKLAHLLKMPERDFGETLRQMESSDLFLRLHQAGVVMLEPYSRARFMTRRLTGFELRRSSTDLSQLLDGQGELVGLIQRIGQSQFEECFLKDKALTIEERARHCGIRVQEAAKILDFVNRLYIQTEFEGGTPMSPETAPAPVFSAVAGIDIEKGLPTLGFFHQDIWKGRYQINKEKQEQWFSSLSPREALRAKRLLSRLEYFNQRKNTLYRVLESLLEIQTEYLVSGDPNKRRPYTQRTLASKLNIETSALNRLISNKAIQMPWGLEAPIKALLPSAKSLLKEHLCSIALAKPGLTDKKLAFELWLLCRARLSPRSIAQYRKELGLDKRKRRVGQITAEIAS